MDRQYYIEYFELERKHWWFRVRGKIIEDFLTKSINITSPLKILNVGAATGRTSEILSKYGEVTSIEYDKDCCSFTSEKLGMPVLHASILDLPFPDSSFDLVCAFDVIEHVEDDGTSVYEMERVCKKGGIIYITVPAFNKLWSHHDVVNHHHRRYVMQDILRLFAPFKGEIIHKTYFNSLLFVPIFCFRMLSNLLSFTLTKKKGSGSDFSVVNDKSIVNTILLNIFSFERVLLRKIRFPVGISILFMWIKSND